MKPHKQISVFFVAITFCWVYSFSIEINLSIVNYRILTFSYLNVTWYNNKMLYSKKRNVKQLSMENHNIKKMFTKNAFSIKTFITTSNEERNENNSHWFIYFMVHIGHYMHRTNGKQRN